MKNPGRLVHNDMATASLILTRSVLGLFLVFTACSDNRERSGVGLVPQVQAAEKKSPGNTTAALKEAEQSNQYLFLLFHNGGDQGYKKMKNMLTSFKKRETRGFRMQEVSLLDPGEVEIIKKYRINANMVPLLLTVAPNGAVTGGFKQDVTPDQLENAFVPDLTMRMLKLLQDGKVVLVVMQNGGTDFNDASITAAQDFASDPRLQGMVEILYEDPLNDGNREFLAQCRLDGNLRVSTIVLLTPPGSIRGVFPGQITKLNLFSALSSCASGSGCAPGACQ